jgi:hypothetical protein
MGHEPLTVFADDVAKRILCGVPGSRPENYRASREGSPDEPIRHLNLYMGLDGPIRMCEYRPAGMARGLLAGGRQRTAIRAAASPGGVSVDRNFSNKR